MKAENNANVTPVTTKLSTDVTSEKVTFLNDEYSLKIAGIVFRPKNVAPTEKLPAIVVNGPMGSIKEQTQSLYASKLAALGYTTITFDYTTFGESEGEPRRYENPDRKASDIKAAVTYLQSRPDVIADRIAGVGICGSGSYMAHATVQDPRIKLLVSVVPFTVMDTFMLKPLEDAIKDRLAYEAGTEAPQYINMMPEGEIGAPYYYDDSRGHIPGWNPNVVSWSEESWVTFKPTEEIKQLKVPYLVITSENAFTRDMATQMFNNAGVTNKGLYTVGLASHFDMYDQDPYVRVAIEQIALFLRDNF
ncbi:MAG: alpha/beta hydrolase [Muribaculum sp.]|nr:alpha/beta hydrolase [Muribaculum sp.]